VVKCLCLSHNGFLTERGYAELAQREHQLNVFCEVGLDSPVAVPYLDKVGSVSALVEVEGSYAQPDAVIDEQYQRFLNGS